MSKAIRRSKKLNSDNDNLYIYDDDTVATFGPVPYDSCYDYSKNSASHIIDTLYLDDNNTFFKNLNEGINIVKPYKI